MLEDILQFQISTNGDVRDMNDSDTRNLLESYSLIERVRDDFLAGLLTFEEYLELLEMHQINVDSYLNTLDENLTTIGAL